MLHNKKSIFLDILAIGDPYYLVKKKLFVVDTHL
jgi:hypothetical protein